MKGRGGAPCEGGQPQKHSSHLGRAAPTSTNSAQLLRTMNERNGCAPRVEWELPPGNPPCTGEEEPGHPPPLSSHAMFRLRARGSCKSHHTQTHRDYCYSTVSNAHTTHPPFFVKQILVRAVLVNPGFHTASLFKTIDKLV